MRDKKCYIALDDFERWVVVNCLNEMRNNLIANGKYTDAVIRNFLKHKGVQAFFDGIRPCVVGLILEVLRFSVFWFRLV